MRVFWLVLLWLVWGSDFNINAQGENNNWTFGFGAGLTFNTPKPTFFQSSMDSKEGCAAISDAFGNLLFYSSGNMVWDKYGNPMPTGAIAGNSGGSATQGVLILKSLSNAEEFYIFTLDPEELSAWNPKLRYSIVNMKLNNGLGDVRSDTKDIVIDDAMEERMVAVASDDCGYWIVGHKKHSDKYVSIKLTSSGLQPPVYSSGIAYVPTNVSQGDIGAMTISPDGTRIATIFQRNTIELAVFDKSTGIISGALTIDSNTLNGPGYGLAFSPDNTKLYATLSSDSKLDQYDMTFYPNASAIKASRTKIVDLPYIASLSFRALRLAPDHKIYIGQRASTYLACINKPNDPGLNCQLDTQALFIPASAYHPLSSLPDYGIGLGMNTVTIFRKDTIPGRRADTLICFSDSALLGVPDNLLSYTWNDGTTGASRYVNQEGIYYCLSTRGCTIRMDTFNVTFVKGDFNLGTDTTICPGDSLVLSVSGDGFRWQDGSTDSAYVINKAGGYFVSINANGCSSADTIIVGIYNAGAVIVENDTIICKDEPLYLHGSAIPVGTLNWNTGSGGTVIEAVVSGSYILEVENVCGTFYDSVKVTIQDCDCRPGIPNAFSPNHDGLNDFFSIVLNCRASHFQLFIYNRFGERVFSSFDQNQGWDGHHKSVAADMGSYFYSLQYETPNGEIIKRKGDLVLVK